MSVKRAAPLTPIRAEEYASLAAFRYALRKFLRFSRDILASEANITSEQYEAMLALKTFKGRNGMSIIALSDRLQVRHHTAVACVNKLEKSKLITRQSATHDRREVHLKLTPRGTTLITRLASIHRVAMRERSPEMIAALQRLAE